MKALVFCSIDEQYEQCEQYENELNGVIIWDEDIDALLDVVWSIMLHKIVVILPILS